MALAAMDSGPPTASASPQPGASIIYFDGTSSRRRSIGASEKPALNSVEPDRIWGLTAI
jgi:hypothetical protein